MFKRLLIANRGEIAVRVIRACRDLGITSVLLCAAADRASLGARLADEVALQTDCPPREAYLDVERVVRAARQHKVDALHPGYGFLSENPALARACDEAGIVFVGPAPEHIAMLGNKNEARARMGASGVPLVPGTERPLATVEEALAAADAIGWPLLLKASMGGGGRGMRRARNAAELREAFASAQSEARTAFGSGDVYLERYLERPRHIEIQVVADGHGNVVHLFERECSIQRRFQKMIEEAPSSAVSPALRRRMGEAAVRGARAIGYRNLATFEFLLDADGNFYFLEVNTRLQVEHPVTEEITGIDLVKTQIEIAAGHPLPFDQEEITLRGWAFEARLTCENPYQNFLPEPGLLTTVELPAGPGVRVDGWVYSGLTVPPYFDSLLAKLIVRGATREEARQRMLRALDETLINGVHTSVPFHRWAFAREAFARGDLSTHFLDEQGWGQHGAAQHLGVNGKAVAPPMPPEALAAALAAIAMRERQGAQPASARASGTTSQDQALQAAVRWREAGRNY
jgi:acetyl-CoA carboxylase biotin carboxylase subunit